MERGVIRAIGLAVFATGAALAMRRRARQAPVPPEAEMPPGPPSGASGGAPATYTVARGWEEDSAGSRDPRFAGRHRRRGRGALRGRRRARPTGRGPRHRALELP